MTRDDAKMILVAWNPESPPDPADAELQEALALAERDLELGRWLRQQRDFHRATRSALRGLAVPPDLADRILAARKTVRPQFGGVGRGLGLGGAAGRWAAVAGIVLLLGLVGAQWFRAGGPAGTDFATFRSRMVRTVTREYRMDVVTNDLGAIRGFLAAHAAPADFALPPGLAALKPTGGGLLSWQGQPVAMVCLDGGRVGTLFLFVVPSNNVAHGRPEAPVIEQVNRLGTVAWTDQGRTYVLAAAAGAESLRGFL